jgi:hypothetical protein
MGVLRCCGDDLDFVPRRRLLECWDGDGGSVVSVWEGMSWNRGVPAGDCMAMVGGLGDEVGIAPAVSAVDWSVVGAEED